MQALRRLVRIRRGVASHALVATLAITGVGLIAYAAVAGAPDPCVGPDCLGIDPAPDPDDQGFTFPLLWNCPPLLGCTGTRWCFGQRQAMCCVGFTGTVCSCLLLSVPTPPGCSVL